MGYWIMKLASMLLIFVVGYQGGLAAIRVSRSARADHFFALGSVFGAGVFLGASLIHVLPDAASNFSDVLPNMDYPLPYMIAAAGFVLIMFIDRAGHYYLERQNQTAETNDLAPYILLLVLSFHSIIAGASLGAEHTTAGSLVLLVAIFAHKGSAAFALGISLVRSAALKAKTQKLIILFSIMTPLGVLIGAGINHILEDRAGQITEGVFDALASATFIYVATIEIIGPEFKSHQNIFTKFAFLIAGLSIMALVAIWL
jgi:zinc transporter 1/2/3